MYIVHDHGHYIRTVPNDVEQSVTNPGDKDLKKLDHKLTITMRFYFIIPCLYLGWWYTIDKVCYR